MQLSVIIPLHNQLALTQAMFASLRETLPAGLEHEVIFVDNGSSDGTADWLKTIDGSRVRSIVHQTNLGYAVANNRAVRQARGDFVALLNNDLVLLQGWFEPMLEIALRPGIGVVGNIQLSARSREIDHAGVFFDATGQPFHLRPRLSALSNTTAIESPAVTGACMLLRRALFLELHGFDENYVNGYEDIDLCLRALSQGHRNAVATHSAAYHHVGASEGRHEGEAANAARFEARRGEFARQLSRIEPAISKSDAGVHATDELPFDRDAFATLQAFQPAPGGYSEQTSSAHLYPTGRWASVSLPLPYGVVNEGLALRMDPCNFPATVRISGFALREATSGNPVWTVGAEELSEVLDVEGTAKVNAASSLTIVSTGSDPQLRLRAASIPRFLAGRSDLIAELTLKLEIGPPHPPTRVAVDLTRLGRGGQNGGIKPFVFDLLQGIAKERGSEFLFIYFTQSSLVSEVEAFRRRADLQICVGESEGCPAPPVGPENPGLVWAPGMVADWRKHWPADVLYAPVGLSPFCQPGLPWIILLADTLHRDHPETLPAADIAYREKWISEGLANAGAVQCISEFTSRQIERHFSAPAGKLFVTHYAIPDRLREAIRTARDAPPVARPYFFYPANDWPHKNHDALLEAYAAYRRQAGAEAWDLTLSGHRARPGAWEARIAALGMEGSCRILGHVEPRGFAAVFQGAGALVFPSFYEGFGIPVLEAMAWGVPVTCSRAASLPEVAGDAALFFDPGEPADIARALGQIATDAGLRRRLVAAGRKRALTFSMAREAGRLADRFAALAANHATQR